MYAEFSLYQSAQIGASKPLDSTAKNPVIRDTAPYARLAYEMNWASTSLEFGALGMNATMLPTGVTDPNTGMIKGLNQVIPNRFYDSGLDAQLEYIPSDETIVTVKALWLHEDQRWGSDAGTANGSNTLDTTRVAGSYYHDRKQGVIAQWFSTTGTQDSGLYATNRTNRPDSSGSILELVYNPYLNTRYSLQYTMYDKFNGAASNFDGNGRNASDNNTLYLLAWLMF